MASSHRYHGCLPDTEVKVAQLLRPREDGPTGGGESAAGAGARVPPGRDVALYTYDLGDTWTHLITLEEERAATAGEVAEAVLAGGGACPPEDSMGFDGMGVGSYEDHVLSAAQPLPKPMQRAMCSACNFPEGQKKFDPFAFDLDVARARVAAAVSARG